MDNDVAIGFNSVAPYYDRLARLVFGKSLIKAQTYFLNRIPSSSRVLVIGGGTGWWLKEFLNNKPECKILYVEESSEMIRLARKASGNDPRIMFKQSTHDSIAEQGEFDAIILFCFLDVFSTEQLRDVIGKVNPSMKANALWLVTDFVERSWWHSVMLFVMYQFFKWTTGIKNQRLPDWHEALLQIRLKEIDQKLFFGGFIKSVFYSRMNVQTSV